MPPEPELTLAQLHQIPHQWLSPWATRPQQHTQGDICPECSLATPTVELERWKMCRFCAQTILFKPTI